MSRNDLLSILTGSWFVISYRLENDSSYQARLKKLKDTIQNLPSTLYEHESTSFWLIKSSKSEKEILTLCLKAIETKTDTINVMQIKDNTFLQGGKKQKFHDGKGNYLIDYFEVKQTLEL